MILMNVSIVLIDMKIKITTNDIWKYILVSRITSVTSVTGNSGTELLQAHGPSTDYSDQATRNGVSQSLEKLEEPYKGRKVSLIDILQSMKE